VTVDSSAAAALSVAGNGQLTAGSVQVVGGASVVGNGVVSPAAVIGVAVLPDPLAGLPVPAGGASMTAVALSSGTMTINPGVYPSIAVSGSGSLILSPGVYVIAGGGFSVSGSASVTVASGSNSVTGHGVLIYNAGGNFPAAGGNFGGISLTGSGTINLTTPDQGTYAGITIFQARDNIRAISLSGHGTALLGGGAIYAPAALLAVNGQAQLQDALVVNRLQIRGGGSSAVSVEGDTGISSGVAGELLGDNLYLYVDNSTGYFTADALARVDDAVAGLDTLLAPYGVTITEVGAAGAANVVLDSSTTTSIGGLSDGVLGVFQSDATTGVGEITLVQGWNLYTGTDAGAVGAGQYDFESIVTHELGHALGLGHSPDASSVMYATLADGVARRTMTVADLNIGDTNGQADALHAAGASTVVAPVAVSPVMAPVSTAATSGGAVAAELSLAFSQDVAPAHAAAWSASGLTAATGPERAEPFGAGLPYRPSASANLLTSGSAAFESELPIDDTTPADATQPLLLDIVFRDWGMSPQGPTGPSRAELRSPRPAASYAVEPGSPAAGVSELPSEALDAFVAWGAADARSGEAFSLTPAPGNGGVVHSGNLLGAITAATALASFAERSRPLSGRARGGRNNLSVSMDVPPEG
jgi:hypothetical protein